MSLDTWLGLLTNRRRSVEEENAMRFPVYYEVIFISETLSDRAKTGGVGYRLKGVKATEKVETRISVSHPTALPPPPSTSPLVSAIHLKAQLSASLTHEP